MEKKHIDVNIGGTAIVIEPNPDGKSFDSKFEKMQKFGRRVLEIGVEKTAGRSSSEMNRNPVENEITK